MNKNKIKNDAIKFISTYGDKIKAKFINVCGKTGRYSVPYELYQKRTPRKNRALITFQTVISNGLSYEQLDSFEGGVVIEFVNNDFFNEIYNGNPLYELLKTKLGSNDNVSAIISIRSDLGSSSSSVQRDAFNKLVSGTKVLYNGAETIITENNFRDYSIKQNIRGKGKGNETWSGFLYVSIRGGQQDTLETHAGQELTLFNPACEYASTEVCDDINLVMLYYAFVSIDRESLSESNRCIYDNIKENIENALEESRYDNETYKGNLLDFVKKQLSVSLIPGQLTDPIQLTKIDIKDFNTSERTPDSIDFTHEEAVIHNKFYWDQSKHCILSPARPTNVFWSFHLSNMMQQDDNLKDYFEKEENRFKRRKKLITEHRK